MRNVGLQDLTPIPVINYPHEMVKLVLGCNAAVLMVAHNHPARGVALNQTKPQKSHRTSWGAASLSPAIDQSAQTGLVIS